MSEQDESRDEVILAALAAGLTHVEAAAAANVSSKTIQRRLRDPAFAAKVAHQRALRVNEVTGRLSMLSLLAVDALEQCLAAEDVPAAIRLRAVEMVFAWLRRHRDEADVDLRITLLEQRTAADAQVALEELK